MNVVVATIMFLENCGELIYIDSEQKRSELRALRDSVLNMSHG